MDSLLQTIRTVQASAGYGALPHTLQNHEHFNCANAEQLDLLIALLLDLEARTKQSYTVGLVLTLLQRAKLPEWDQEAFATQTAQVLNQLDGPQTCFVAKQVKTLCATFTKTLFNLQRPMLGIKPLYSAIRALSAEHAPITPLHAMLLQLCIGAHAYKAALPILTSKQLDPDLPPTKIEVRDLCLYFYYAGIAWIGNGCYADAANAFRTAILTPVPPSCQITLEAYKKLVLVSLIDDRNESNSSPPFSVSGFPKHIRLHCQPYDNLLNAYLCNSYETLKETFLVERDAWQQDRNLGLVKQVLKSFQIRHVQQLTNVYSSLPLDGVASHSHLSAQCAAEQLIVDCVQRKKITASISQRDACVTFNDHVDHDAPDETTARLNRNLADVLSLHQVLADLDERIFINQKYLEKTYCTVGRADVPGINDMEAIAKLTKTH